ncbi:Bacterial Ig-like domain (group 2) [uncultured archaeon]|nr:Bacterial Ig-like domain (group 2) [uncultured archaeon]
MIKRILIFTALLLLLVTTNAEAATNITGCGTISIPGSYILNVSIDGATANSCINITANNVILDGGNKRISGMSKSNSVGVFVSKASGLQNIKVANLSVSNWTYGIQFLKTQNSFIENNTVSNNSFGFYLQNSKNITLNDNRAEPADSNSAWDFYSFQAENFSVNNLWLKPNNTIITFRGENISLKEAYSPAPDPGKLRNISYFVVAENNSVNSWLNLTIHYKQSDVPPLNENTLRMWRWNGSWKPAETPNNVDTADNIVYGNTTSFGEKGFYILAPMGLDNTPPIINSVILDNYTPNTGDPINISVNATDNAAVIGVEANGISLIAQGGDFWNGTITAAAGTNSVNVSASDAAGNVVWDNNTFYTATTSAPVLTTITVSPSSPSIVNGTTQAFTASGYDQYGGSMPVTVTWASSNTSVGTIDSTGLLTTLEVGTTTISATDGLVVGNTVATVTLPLPVLTTIVVSPANTTILAGNSQTFTASGFDQYGAPIAASVLWNSSDPSVGTINATGVFTAVAAGTTNINATDGIVVGTTSVKVRDSDLSGFTGGATVSRGGLLTTTVTVTNYASTPQNYTIEVSGVTASGDPLVGTGTLVNLGAGQSLNIPVLVAIPSAAATGSYTLNAYLWKHDEFPTPGKLIITSTSLTVTVT